MTFGGALATSGICISQGDKVTESPRLTYSRLNPQALITMETTYP